MKRLFKVGSDRHDVGKVIFSWHPEGNFLASAGRNGVIHITDRHGDFVDEIPLSTAAPILALEWDREGENLAVLQEGNGAIPLWNLSSRRISSVETTLKDPSFLAWSRSGPQLAIGTSKGSLLIYNKARKVKSSVVSKHTKRISCGAWSSRGNKLVLGSDDRSLSVSNENGDALLFTELKYAPTQIMFTSCASLSPSAASEGKERDRERERDREKEDGVVSATLNGKSLLLYNILDERDDPLELTFASSDGKYGEIVFHHWLEENLVLVGFSRGYLVLVSTSPSELGEEKRSLRIHSESLSTFAYNAQLKRIATAGNDGVKILDVRDFSECKGDAIVPEDIENGRIHALSWSPDGQILSVATSAGNVYNFLAKMQSLFAAYGASVGYLSSLREVSVVDVVRRQKPVDVTVKLEPALIAIGPRHVAAGMNNRVYYHRINNNNNNTSSSKDRDRDRERDREGVAVNEQEYIGAVREIHLNADFAVVLTESKAILHPIEPSLSPASAQLQTKTFPSREEGSFSRITCVALTDNFLFYGTEAGTVEIFFLAEWVLLAGVELRLMNPVKKLFPNESGTRVVVVDGANQSFLFNPVSSSAESAASLSYSNNNNSSSKSRGNNNSSGSGSSNVVQNKVTVFEAAPANVLHVMWDLAERNVIIFFDGANVHTYIYVPTSIKGSLLVKLGPITISAIGEITLKPDKVELPPGNTPILSHGGVFTCQSSAGTLTTFTHPFFDQIEVRNKKQAQMNSSASRKLRSGYKDPDEMDAKKDAEHKANFFCQTLALHKLDKSWEMAVELKKKSFFLALSNKAMELLDVQLAYLVYNQLGDAAMVMALEELMQIEDKNLLAGNIAMLFCDYQRAQDLFLASSRPVAALDMRRDLLHWEQALKLAQILAPTQVPEICIAYGQQLEVRDQIDLAQQMFRTALESVEEIDGNVVRVISSSLEPVAKMGVARCQMRLGNVRPAMHLANELSETSFFLECANILEQQKQFSEAAAMFVKAKQYERAAQIYIQQLLKNDKSRIAEAVPIMQRVENNAISSAFGKICKSERRYEDALKAFRRANDFGQVVEIQLRFFDQVQQAFDLVRTTSSAEGAQIVAKYCAEHNDFRGAIEFLLIAGKSDEAFKLAQTQNIVEVYTSFLDENITSEEAMRVASHYEKNQDFGKAGRFYGQCGQYSRALRLFLQCGDREIDAAIEVVGKSQNESLIQQLIDFLAGEKDGVPKDSSYSYRLYLALKKYEHAAKTAVLIAKEEQELGNYAEAHRVLVETIRCLEDAQKKVPLPLRQSFILLHSYSLVKILVKRNEHNLAARLLLRVVQNITRFPKHIVPLLTSTVIECQRAGLKASAFEYATTLVRPEYRAQLTDPNLKRKIEAMVRRRSANNEDVPEPRSPCPVSDALIPVTQLECPTTQDALPMCVVTGQHMVLEDWCFCPVSRFPALYSEYVKYIRDLTRSLRVREGEEEKEREGGSDADPQTDSASPAQAVEESLWDSLTAPDPVTGQSVAVKDLVKASPEEARNYILRYNNQFVTEKKKDNGENNQDGEEESNGNGNGNGNGNNGKSKSRKESSQDGDLEDSTNAVNGSVAGKEKKSSSKSPSKSSTHRSKLERIQRAKKRRNQEK